MSYLLILERHLEELSTKKEKRLFHQMFAERQRQQGVVIALALIFGWVGAHRFYLKETGPGIMFALAGTIGWFLVFPPFIALIFVIVDAVNSKQLVDKCNNRIAREIIQEIQLLERIEASGSPEV